MIFHFLCIRGDRSPGIQRLSFGSVLCLGSEESETQQKRLIGLWAVEPAELLLMAQEDYSYVRVSSHATDAA